MWFLLASYLTNDSINIVSLEIAIGIASLLMSISGFAQIRKKEMPGPFGRIIRGKIAVISGILLIVFFGSGSLLAFGHSIFLILQS